MQAKIHKAKLLTIQNQTSDVDQRINIKAKQQSTIHTYLNILNQIMKRNKQHVRKSSYSTPKAVFRGDSNNNDETISRNQLKKLIIRQKLHWKDVKLAELDYRQQTFKNYKQLKNTNRRNKSTQINEKYSKTEHTDEAQQSTKFIPIGNVYQKLRLKTQKEPDAQINKFRSISCIKMAIQNKNIKNMNIFRKPFHSKERSNLRLENLCNNLNSNQHQSEHSCQMDRQCKPTSTKLRHPTPW